MDEKTRYNYYKKLHPEWSEEQIWTAVSLDIQAKDTIKSGGDDVDVTAPEFIRQIIIKAQDWLEEVLPIVFEKVKQFFHRAISSIVDWAVKGWDYIMNLIGSNF